MSIKLIAMDLDGTLLDSQNKLPEPNAEAISAAAKRGIEIVIVTGRRFHSARLSAAPLSCNVDFIASNGALIKSASGETFYRRLLPVEVAREVLERTPEFRACAGVIFDRPRERQVIFEKIDWNGAYVGPYLARHREQVAEVQPLTQCLDGEDPVEILYLSDCAAIRRVSERLANSPLSSHFTLATTEYQARNLSMLDVLQRGVSKGAALAEWASRRGIAPAEVMAIGDNWNDREMLQYAGLPVVMGNSVSELKETGWQITLSNDDCGVARAIRKYVLEVPLVPETDQADSR
ncbi:MAG: HAD family phosphatase [Acidobacteriota bacterium]|nr:HAD family phosphatase [Acidobacteriota bacterium]